MKKSILFAVLFLAVGTFAQNKFIEVEVTDTISLTPLSYKCNLYVDTYDYDMVVEATPVDIDGTATATPDNSAYDNYDPLAAEEKIKNKIEGFKKMLESKKFKVLPLDESGTDAFGKRRYDQTGFTVIANSKTELQTLKELIEPKKEVTASVSILKYADEQKADEVLIKRILDRAKTMAAVIGANSGLKPGRIIEVKQGKPGAEQGISELYSQILKMGSYGQGIDTTPPTKSKTFIVKFSAE
ncbi:hypothetical protein R1T16_03910 [Flavobacterium sp. DG1-102-2]|uniref:hypothetical protein n=1 Tax=Flavobacterium sp. DG1-102-2 TaxID=3081663 RepID=UPI002949D833|nr:hypothetical protein [Flavobacterium sp. DG1-102-2]MDV6167557.1 hypothetical protein [Flavobacterium sp. DG1-102-2]